MEQIASKNSFVSFATQMVEKNIKLENYNLDMFANDLCMCKSKLSKKVKDATGLTPIEFIRNVKFNFAFRLFKETNLSIKEVAYSTGFNDPKYFSRCFKRTYGVTPKDYKSSLSKAISYMWYYFNMN